MVGSEFRSLPDDPDAFSSNPLPLDPSATTGKLTNGLRYFIGHAAKPKGRIAMALVVAVGSLVEEDHEQGVAHILEHLAFNATEKYSNHDIIKFLESIGAEFGACQNAHTGFDETAYELLVPTQDLEKGLSVFAQFAAHIRCDPEDLKKERGAVLDEWRGTRSADGRAMETDWKIMCQGCKYADRLPIGKESIIRNVPAETVKAFYEKWYTADRMAVILMGDMTELDSIPGIIEKHLGGVRSSKPGQVNDAPRCLLPAHSQPRYHSYVDKEQEESNVHAIFQKEAPELKSSADLKAFTIERLVGSALNRRLFRLSRQLEPPFYAASVSRGAVTRTIYSSGFAAVMQEGCHEIALEAILVEIARAQEHGFSQKELDSAIAQEMADAESAYRERGQTYSVDLREEYERHFITGEAVIGQEKEPRLTKTILKTITLDDLLEEVQQFTTDRNCVIRAISHRRPPSQESLQAVVDKVARMKAGGEIKPWDGSDDVISILDSEPQPGEIEHTRDYPYIKAKEYMLGNGMKVCFKHSTLMDDQVLITGSADGGLSELDKKQFETCSYAFRLAPEIGQFGHPPEVLSDALMGKRVELNLGVSVYGRVFSGEASPTDIETALQLIHRLFTHDVLPSHGDLTTGLKFLRESIQNEERNPMKVYLDRVAFINHSNNYLYEPSTLERLDRIDPELALKYFNDCYKNPAAFTVCFTGNIEESELLPLVERYLASIPSTDHPPVIPPTELRATPDDFPTSVVIEDVRTSMIAPQGQALITVPVSLPITEGRINQREIYACAFSARLLETRLLRILRFQRGEVYGVMANIGWRSGPAADKEYQGELSIHFTCEPSATSRLTKLALEALENLQETPCEREDLDSLLSIERQRYEEQQEENLYWHSLLVAGYGSRSYRKLKDIDKVVRQRDEAREDFLTHIDPGDLVQCFRTALPYPVASRYTVITFSPQLPFPVRVLNSFRDPKGKALWTAGVCGVALATFCLIRRLLRRRGVAA